MFPDEFIRKYTSDLSYANAMSVKACNTDSEKAAMIYWLLVYDMPLVNSINLSIDYLKTRPFVGKSYHHACTIVRVHDKSTYEKLTKYMMPLDIPNHLLDVPNYLN